MHEIRLIFGRPVAKGREEILSALRDLQAHHDCIVQALDAEKVVSNRHILFATEKALSAISQGRNIARDHGMEIMRYASGERQIQRALHMGVSDCTKRIVLVLARPASQCNWPDEKELSGLLEPDGVGCSCVRAAVKEAFNISTAELDLVGEGRLEDLVLERVALADTYR